MQRAARRPGFPYVRWTIIGLFVLAMVLDYLARSVVGVVASPVLNERVITSAFQLGVMFQSLIVYLLDSVGLRIGFAICATLSVTVITMASDLFRRDEVATAAGFAGLAENLGILLFTLALGRLVDRVGYGPFFIVLGLLDLVGAALLWTFVRSAHDSPSQSRS